MKGKLSVVVPIYNVEPYLKQCLDSVIKQTYSNLDIILVDDGSTDLSGEIADKYKKDARVTVIHKENEGLLKARLDGVRKAQGEYITFVDADDWIEQDMYSKMMKHIITSDVDMVLCGMNRFWSKEKNIISVPFLGEGLYDENALRDCVWNRMLWDSKKGINGIDASLCSKIVRRSILLDNLEKASEVDIYLGEDAAILFPTMLEIESLFVMHQAFYYHRQRESREVAPYVRDSKYFEKLMVLHQYLKDRLQEKNVCDEWQTQLDLFIMKFIPLRKTYLEEVQELQEPVFPFSDMDKESKVVIYGAGRWGQEYVIQNQRFHFCQIVLWVDKNFDNFDKTMEVRNPEDIKNVTFDYIIIAVQSVGIAREIKDELISQGIPKEKIVWKTATMRSFV